MAAGSKPGRAVREVFREREKERRRESGPEQRGACRGRGGRKRARAEERVRPREERGEECGLRVAAGEDEERRESEAREVPPRRAPGEPPSEEKEQRHPGRRERVRVLEPRDEGARERERDGAERGGLAGTAAVAEPQERGRGGECRAQEQREVPAGAQAEDEGGPDERRAESRLGVAEERDAAVLVRIPEREPPREELAAREREPRDELQDGVRQCRRLERPAPGRSPRPEARLDPVRENDPLVHAEAQGERGRERHEGRTRRGAFSAGRRHHALVVQFRRSLTPAERFV